MCFRAHALRCSHATVTLELWADEGEFRLKNQMEWVDLDENGGDVYEYRLDTATMCGLYWYKAADQEEVYQLSVYKPRTASPQWYNKGVTYHIFVDRFFRGNPNEPKKDSDFDVHFDLQEIPCYLPDEHGEILNRDIYGGDLLGIIQKLPYLYSLGVKTIYLSPIFEAWSNHKYNTADFQKIDEHFGNTETLILLCKEAKRYDIQIILDGVFNHVGSDSVYFNCEGRYPLPGAWQTEPSSYDKWFHIKEDRTYESWWGIWTLPTIDKTEPSYIQFITQTAQQWMKTGIAGWRLDVADELPDSFLQCFYKSVKQEKEDALILGEVWEDASNKIAYSVRKKYFTDCELDGVMNYPLRNAILGFLAGRISAKEAARQLEILCIHYPPPILQALMNPIGTHDTPRVLTALIYPDIAQLTREEQVKIKLTQTELVLAKKKLRQAAVLQYGFPGSPSIYYGDEAGVEGGADPFNRTYYPWGKEDLSLIAFYQMLGWLKCQASCMHTGNIQICAPEESVLIFCREENGQKIFFCVGDTSLKLYLPSEDDLYDVLSGKRYRAHFGCVIASVPSSGYRILTNDHTLRYHKTF